MEVGYTNKEYIPITLHILYEYVIFFCPTYFFYVEK